MLARRAPVLLAAHASVRYLAVLFGGQHRLRRLREMWGPAVPSASYEFAGPVAETRAAFCRQANQFYALLGPVTRRAFYDELITAWEFAAHTLGGDVSGLAREHRERLGLTSARMALA